MRPLLKGNVMIKKFQNLDPITKTVIKYAAIKMVATTAAVAVMYVVTKKLEEKIPSED